MIPVRARRSISVGTHSTSEKPVPVTARLSRRFYDALGDEVANELVEWFNAVDSTYRSDLERINELNFARFDAKVEQRFAEQDAKWERRFAEQTRWFYVTWAVQLAALVALWFKP